MTTRRQLLMSAAVAGAGGLVVVATRLLGRKRPSEPAPALVKEDTPEPGPLRMTPRSAWGALEPDVSTGGWGENGPYSAANPNGWLIYGQPLDEVLHTIIVHHSALPLSDGPLAIQRLHMQERGFADIGYHYLIDEQGRLYEGRDLRVRGAHTYGHNHGSVGVCLIGNFEEIQPSAAQLTTLEALLSGLVEHYPRITRLAGHKDFNPGQTLCPGSSLAPLLPEMAEKLGLEYGGAA